MTETRRRIKAYQAALPALRERVAAVALLLLMSTAMMVSASFAWVTLSTNPEVAGAMTTVAANGNLEIALAGRYKEETQEDGTVQYTLLTPDASAIGDSSASDGQTVAASNLTWGNLVNLSDPSYGLDNIVLRPAALNTSSLKTNPFRSAVYGEDGRVIDSNFNEFSYCIWTPTTQEAIAHFEVSEKTGVRAISTVTTVYEADMGASEDDLENVRYFRDRISVAEAEQNEVHTKYPNTLLSGKNSKGDEYMVDLCSIMGWFLTKKFNGSSYPEMWQDTVCTVYQLESLVGMYTLFYETQYAEFEAMAALANAQQFIATGDTSYIPYTADTLITAKASDLTAKGIYLEGFTQFVKDYNTIKADKEAMEALYAEATDEVSPRSIKMTEIEAFVNNLVVVSTCWIHKGNTSVQVKDIGGVSDAMSLIGSGMEVEIEEGILARFEQRTGAYVSGSYTVSLAVKRDLPLFGVQEVPLNQEAKVYTTAKVDQTNKFQSDRVKTEEDFANSPLNKGKKIQTAGDTYGMAIDLWVRTNATDSDGGGTTYLVLEGDLVYEVAKGMDADGNLVGEKFYYVEEGEATESSEKIYIYRLNNRYYLDGTNDEVTNLAGKTLTIVYDNAPVGYEGENRVWEEWQQAQLNPALGEHNTTQGSGSCFTFYADSPTEQQAILNLLSHMYVVFTDGGNNYLSTASFDSAENHYYAVGGKVTVPLIVTDSQHRYVDENGETNYAITTLERNVATRVTALVYLDGSGLSNKEALSASDVKGTLNIQFGSNVDLQTIGDKDLQEAERTVSAKVTTENANNVLNFFNSKSLEAEVSVTVTGDRPGTVRAFFQREINASQGSREQEMIFTPNGDGTYTAKYTFTAPGDYVLRSIQLDGSNYELDSPQRVTIEGFLVDEVTVMRNSSMITDRASTIITTDNFVSFDLSLRIRADATNTNARPDNVELVFMKSDASTISVKLTRDNEMWRGTVTLNTSGLYKLSLVGLNGKLYDLGSAAKEFMLYMGMIADVYLQEGTPTNVLFKDNFTSTDLGINVLIRDNSGTRLNGLTDVKLYYVSTGNKQLEAQLTWNSGTGFYEGKFINVDTDGTYSFQYVTAGQNYIAKTQTAPVFRVRSIIPVGEPTCTNEGTIFAHPEIESSTAYMHLRIKNTGSAQIRAYFNNSDEYVMVEAPSSTDAEKVSSWVIRLPNNAQGNQGGEWTLTKLEMTGVTDDRGNNYDIDDGTWMQYIPENPPTIKVVSDFKAEIIGVSANLGKAEDGSITAKFLDSHTVNGFALEIYYLEDENDPTSRKALDQDIISAIRETNPTLKLRHQGAATMETYGGYRTDVPGDIVITLDTCSTNAENTVTTFTSSQPISLNVAGEYKISSASIMLKGVDFGSKAVDHSGSLITVSSIKPYLRFTATNPAASQSFTGFEDNYKDTQKTTSRSNEITDDNKSVKCFFKSSSKNCGTSTVATASTATLGLYDAGTNFTSGSCFVDGSAHDVTFTFTPDSLYSEQNMGSSSGSGKSIVMNIIGTNVKVTQFVLVSNGQNFTFTLAQDEQLTVTAAH